MNLTDIAEQKRIEEGTDEEEIYYRSIEDKEPSLDNSKKDSNVPYDNVSY